MGQVILIVDDSNSIRMAVADLLKTNGYDVVEAVDGRDGISKLDGRKINLIISDYNMPHVNGLEFVLACRTFPAYKFTPIIMLTTEGSDAQKSIAKQSGVKVWLKKPFVAKTLLDTISKMIIP